MEWLFFLVIAIMLYKGKHIELNCASKPLPLKVKTKRKKTKSYRASTVITVFTSYSSTSRVNKPHSIS